MTRRRTSVALAVLVGGVAAAVAYFFVWPPAQTQGRADAVVVLGHGLSGERLPKALQLMSRGVAPVLVVSRARDPGSPTAGAICRDHYSFQVVCFRATPFTTRGEARHVARLADERGWRSLVLVTSTYHLSRARMLHGRCFHGRLDAVGARPHAGFLEEADAILHETGALIYSSVVARDC